MRVVLHLFFFFFVVRHAYHSGTSRSPCYTGVLYIGGRINSWGTGFFQILWMLWFGPRPSPKWVWLGIFQQNIFPSKYSSSSKPNLFPRRGQFEQLSKQFQSNQFVLKIWMLHSSVWNKVQFKTRSYFFKILWGKKDKIETIHLEMVKMKGLNQPEFFQGGGDRKGKREMFCLQKYFEILTLHFNLEQGHLKKKNSGMWKPFSTEPYL